MDEYLSHIERLDELDSPELINNSSTEHAIPLVAKLFARGRKEILVFTGSLDPKIYAQKPVIDALGVFLVGRSGKLSVLIQKDATEVSDATIATSESGLISALRSEYGSDVVDSNITVRRVCDRTRKAAKQHFLVVDNKGFRFEPDNTKHEAVASFNMPKVANGLTETFNQHLVDSCVMALPQTKQ